MKSTTKTPIFLSGGGPVDFWYRCGIDIPFPLTLSLSLGERGADIARWNIICAALVTERGGSFSLSFEVRGVDYARWRILGSAVVSQSGRRFTPIVRE